VETFFGEIEAASGALARERVLTDLNNLARDTEALLKALAGKPGDQPVETRARIGATVERVKATYNEFQNLALTNARSAARNADTVIRQYPYPSLGVAFGLGLLIGALVGRK